MRRFSAGLTGTRARGALAPGAALVAAGLLAVAAAPAGATITPVTHDTAGSLQAVQAAAGPGFTVGGQGAFFVPAAPGKSVGIGTTGLPGSGALWGNGKGKFRTSGKYSSATVRGTIWLTQDRCDGTLTRVKRGIVSVRDFKRRRTVSVKAGHSYLARAADRARGAK